MWRRAVQVMRDAIYNQPDPSQLVFAASGIDVTDAML
jgi:hypothetical protein